MNFRIFLIQVEKHRPDLSIAILEPAAAPTYETYPTLPEMRVSTLSSNSVRLLKGFFQNLIANESIYISSQCMGRNGCNKSSESIS
jgi:hypothetical protein